MEIKVPMDIKIAIAYHRDAPILKSDIFIPVYAGSHSGNAALDMARDDSGYNISELNYTYCEMTVAYWLWKNVKADVKGIFHYRRILGIDRSLIDRAKFVYHKVLGQRCYPSVSCERDQFFKQADKFQNRLPEIMAGCDVVVPRPMLFGNPVELSFLFVGDYLLKLLESSLENLYPQYIPTFQKTLSGRKMYNANISVMRNGIFDEYAYFLFDVLEDVRRRVVSEGWLLDPEKEKAFGRRMGYLAELLTNTFIVYWQENGLIRVRELPSFFLTE